MRYNRFIALICRLENYDFVASKGRGIKLKDHINTTAILRWSNFDRLFYSSTINHQGFTSSFIHQNTFNCIFRSSLETVNYSIFNFCARFSHYIFVSILVIRCSSTKVNYINSLCCIVNIFMDGHKFITFIGSFKYHNFVAS